MKIKGAIFDMDGTLINSLWCWDELWEWGGRTYLGIEGFRPAPEFDKAVRTMVLADAMDGDEPALVIAYAPCRIAAKLTKEGLCEVDADKCKACGACFKMGCPAMTRGQEIRKGAFKMEIDPNLCAGCKQCSQVCKFNAIKRVK